VLRPASRVVSDAPTPARDPAMRPAGRSCEDHTERQHACRALVPNRATGAMTGRLRARPVLGGGARIAFEPADRRMVAHFKEAEPPGCERSVCTAVVAEVWRGARRSARMGASLGACVIEPVDAELARSAGEALAMVRVTLDCEPAIGAQGVLKGAPRRIRSVASPGGGRI
jgi:hypothetical protein